MCEEKAQYKAQLNISICLEHVPLGSCCDQFSNSLVMWKQRNCSFAEQLVFSRGKPSCHIGKGGGIPLRTLFYGLTPNLLRNHVCFEQYVLTFINR
jgi:hypothetical protein